MDMMIAMVPGFIALVMALLFKRQNDLNSMLLQQRADHLEGMMDEMNASLTRLVQAQRDLRTEWHQKYSDELEKHETKLAHHQRFIENLTAVSVRTPEQKSEKEQGRQKALHERIEQGESSDKLAREFGVHLGEVELMKNLKKFAH
jgi:hypothetical protein